MSINSPAAAIHRDMDGIAFNLLFFYKAVQRILAFHISH